MGFKLNDSDQSIYVKGRLVPSGVFYETNEETEFVTTDDEQEAQHVELLSGDDDEKQPITIPDEKNVTMEKMKQQLSEWGTDYSAHDTNKSTLYAFFVEEAKKRGTE
ncbi:hypothetical protein POF51_22515 [Brevibacillus sp. AG]|uniref:hypothetical protein n=1 Tax=Brevibacillus sp. AG TaxID=3020891 RepID=UPI0023315B34|nr:hypothetical protein [Brevibacillus sp. AG]MDC0763503.1 hypothetical protein [Brevibacillus sp. AG]